MEMRQNFYFPMNINDIINLNVCPIIKELMDESLFADFLNGKSSE